MLDRLYAGAVGARRRWFERHPEARRTLARPVISVGNLSVGGTGKTPVVAAIAQWLLTRGERPAILSRGYGRARHAEGVVVVSDGERIHSDADHAGDEPLMLARRLPGAVVCVCDDRHLAGVLAERRLGATVHVLDDGFQHVTLARDLDILVTAPGEILRCRVLPFGRLREAPGAAARAHVAVIMDADTEAARREGWELGVSQVVGARRVIPGPASSADAAGAADAGGTTGTAATGIAIAGIARPERFFEMLRGEGYRVVETLAFGDHHRYTAADVERIARSAARAGADTVLTTAKDAVRFERLQPLPFKLVPVEMTLAFDGWDVLAACIEAALERRRGVA